jgi:PAS domain S-box-containing protein/putative nucleotidyltransferase with HDIG domain
MKIQDLTLYKVYKKIKQIVNQFIYDFNILKFSSNQNETIEDTKKQLLFWILIALNVFGLPTIMIAIIESLSLKQYLVSISYFVFYSPIIIVTLRRKKMSYKTISMFVIVISYILGIANLIVWGFAGAGVPILITFLVFTTLFLDLKNGIIAIIICLMPMIIIGFLYTRKILFLSSSLNEILTLPISWITASAVLTLLGTLIVASFGIIHRKMMFNVQYSESQAIALSKKNVQLKMDIIKRKQAEGKLRKSEEKFRTLYEQSNDAIFLYNLEGKILDVNTRVLKMLGYKKEGIISKYIQSLLPKDEFSTVKKAFQQTKEQGDVRFESRFIRKDGSQIFVDISSKLVDQKKEIVQGVVRDITEQKQSQEKLKKTIDATLDTISKLIEAKDPYTAGHQQRVSQLATAIAKELSLSQDKIEGIRIASLIHDIGKIGIPTEILSKPTKLSDIEFSLIKNHSQIGYDILKSIDFSYPVANIALQHHEKLDGSGYPNHLKGDEVLLEARIIGVADVVEAISSHRPYRPALGIDKALEEISQNRGILYDPEVVDACLKLFKEKEFKFESE